MQVVEPRNPNIDLKFEARLPNWCSFAALGTVLLCWWALCGVFLYRWHETHPAKHYEFSALSGARNLPSDVIEELETMLNNARDKLSWASREARLRAEQGMHKTASLGEAVKDKASEVKEKAYDIGSKTASRAESLGEAIKDKAYDIGSATVDKAESFGEAVKEALKEKASEVKEKASEVKEALKEKASELKETVASHLPSAKEVKDTLHLSLDEKTPPHNFHEEAEPLMDERHPKQPPPKKR